MPEPPPNELETIRAAAGGDRAAFERVVSAYAARIRWLIQMRLDPAVRARVSVDDVMQDVLVVVSDRIRRLVIDHERAFWAWLCKVIEQRLIDVRRRHVRGALRDVRREQPLDAARPGASMLRLADVLADSATSPSANLRSAEQREAVAAAMQRLPASYREVILLRVFEGQNVAETAEIMGRTPGAISVLLNKAIKRLAGVLSGGTATPNE